MKRIKSAWVIYQTGTSADKTIISILSSRYNGEEVSKKIEYLYALLHYDLAEHLDYFGRYNCKNPPYTARSSSEINNSENFAIHHPVICCGHNPFIIAELGRNIELSENGQMLEWNSPDRIRIDLKTGDKVITQSGARMKTQFKNMVLSTCDLSRI